MILQVAQFRSKPKFVLLFDKSSGLGRRQRRKDDKFSEVGWPVENTGEELELGKQKGYSRSAHCARLSLGLPSRPDSNQKGTLLQQLTINSMGAVLPCLHWPSIEALLIGGNICLYRRVPVSSELCRAAATHHLRGHVRMGENFSPFAGLPGRARVYV